MEKNDLKKIEKELVDMKTYLMAQAHIQKNILMEIKQLRRDLKKSSLSEEIQEESKSQH